MQPISVLQKAKYHARWLLGVQAVIAVFIAIFFYLYFGPRAMYSGLLGGFVCLAGNWFFMKQFFSKTGARAARSIVWNLYLGEAGKIALTVVLFLVIFQYMHVQVLLLFVGYITTQASYWLVPGIFKEYK